MILKVIHVGGSGTETTPLPPKYEQCFSPISVAVSSFRHTIYMYTKGRSQHQGNPPREGVTRDGPPMHHGDVEHQLSAGNVPHKAVGGQPTAHLVS